jgi:hypothetical protein
MSEKELRRAAVLAQVAGGAWTLVKAAERMELSYRQGKRVWGRIQRFNLDGRYLGEWTHLGKTFSLKITPAGDLWIGTQPHDVANGVESWLVRVERRTGKIIGCVESGGHHSIEVNAEGEPLTGARPDKVQWFRSVPRTEPRP